MIVIILLGFGFYYALFRAGKFVKDHPAQSLKAAAMIGQALRK